MKLSIIICVYNTKEEYVDECLSSIHSSTVSDFEIIFVDDGSTVDYSSILKKYIPRYIRTENQGLLRARFAGVREARGDYIAFVDSDDTVSINYHAPMLLAAERENADIVFNDWAFDFGGSKSYPTQDTTIKTDVSLSGDEALVFYTSQAGREQSYFVQWNKLYRRELLFATLAQLEKTDVFSKKITYAEDVIINFFNFKHARRVTGVHTGFYFYRSHPDQSVSTASAEKIKAQVDSMCYALSLMENGIGGHPQGADILQSLEEWRGLISRFHYSHALDIGSMGTVAYIKEKYGVSRLRLPTKQDEKAYTRVEFIGSNFPEIDRKITALYSAVGDIDIALGSRSLYVRRFCLCAVRLLDGRVTVSRASKNRIPKNKLTLKGKILSSSFLSVFVLLYRSIKQWIRRARIKKAK